MFQNAIANLKEENGYLKVFKQTHDKLQESKRYSSNNTFMNEVNLIIIAQLITPPTTASPTVLANTKVGYWVMCIHSQYNTSHHQTEMDQHHATTEKLKIQLLSLQNSLTDGAKLIDSKT